MSKPRKINKLFVGAVILCVCAVASSFLVPQFLLNREKKNGTDIIYVAPESYYVESGNAMARNTSSNLTSLEQVKLISGDWESTGAQCALDQGFLTENEAVQLARYSLNNFYNMGVFPYSTDANYNNWCSWESKLYCYTDTLFNTYTAYLWVITFTKFDNSSTHTVYMTEKGVILGATTTDKDYKANKIISAYSDSSVKDIFADENISLLEKEAASEGTVINPVYPDTDYSDATFSQIYKLHLVSSDGQPEHYYVYQYTTDEVYGIGLVPVSE